MVAVTALAEDRVINPDVMVPELIQRHPEARAVLDRYGLRGCGGRLGPVESIAFFARTHGVEEGRLMREIAAAIDAARQTGAAPPPAAATIADTLYRRFFTAGIALILTAGATWGAFLLWKIGFAGKFTGVGIHEVNAHGHAQIFGWVGLFIMGFAYQAFPRIWHTDLVRPRLAVAVFVMMITGLVVGTTGMALAGRSGAVAVAVAGGMLEVIAIVLFAGQILATYRRGNGRWEPYVAFVVVGLGWFVAMAVMSTWHTWTTMTAPTRERLLWYVATYQAPLRDLQIHGLPLFMIFGVSLRMLPALFGVAPVRARRAWWALGLLTAGVLGESSLFVVHRWTGNHVWAGMLMLPWIMLLGGVMLIAGPWRLWRPFKEGDRSGKFVRMAYAWLFVSLVMLLFLPAYSLVSGLAFSHAYYGAIRHAITVGFISLMIMGFAAKVVPTLNGIDTRTLSPLWGPFVLVNLGCFLRVSMQTLTDFHPGFFAVIGVSGMLEVAGLAWWGIGLAGIMRRGKRAMENPAAEEPSACSAIPRRIEASHHVADILLWHPRTADVFDAYGFTLLKNPILRRTLARGVTVSQATSLRGVNTEEFLAALNRAVEGGPVFASVLK